VIILSKQLGLTPLSLQLKLKSLDRIQILLSRRNRDHNRHILSLSQTTDLQLSQIRLDRILRLRHKSLERLQSLIVQRILNRERISQRTLSLEPLRSQSQRIVSQKRIQSLPIVSQEVQEIVRVDPHHHQKVDLLLQEVEDNTNTN